LPIFCTQVDFRATSMESHAATPAKIAANRRTALLSTGPRTPAGKLVVSQDAIRHGVFANLPVVPGESEADWQTHHRGILDSLAPVGLLEVNLAERVALVLWRLARLAKYEAANTATAIEEVGLLPPDADPLPYLRRHHNRNNQLLLAEQEHRREREAFFAARADANFLRSVLARSNVGEPLPAKAVLAVLGEAYTLALDCPIRQYEPAWHSDRTFLDRLGLTPDRPAAAAWSREHFLAALDYYAGATEWPADEFRAELQRTLDSRTDGFARGVKRREAEVAALNRRREAEAERLAASALVPPDAAADRIIKYEKHLHAQLTSTMHELERLQARRGGAFVPPPQVADLHVIINGE
jgi:hypothetical protein